MLGRFGRTQVCKTGASKGKTEVQAGQCSRCSGPLAGPACRRKNTHRPAQRKNACQKPAAVLCSKRKKEERERYGRNAHSLKASHKHVFTQWGLDPMFVLESGGCCRVFPFCGTAWNYAAACISGPFCAQTRPSGTFCKGREVFLCRKFCYLQTI